MMRRNTHTPHHDSDSSTEQQQEPITGHNIHPTGTSSPMGRLCPLDYGGDRSWTNAICTIFTGSANPRRTVNYVNTSTACNTRSNLARAIRTKNATRNGCCVSCASSSARTRKCSGIWIDGLVDSNGLQRSTMCDAICDRSHIVASSFDHRPNQRTAEGLSAAGDDGKRSRRFRAHLHNPVVRISFGSLARDDHQPVKPAAV